MKRHASVVPSTWRFRSAAQGPLTPRLVLVCVATYVLLSFDGVGDCCYDRPVVLAVPAHALMTKPLPELASCCSVAGRCNCNQLMLLLIILP